MYPYRYVEVGVRDEPRTRGVSMEPTFTMTLYVLWRVFNVQQSIAEEAHDPYAHVRIVAETHRPRRTPAHQSAANRPPNRQVDDISSCACTSFSSQRRRQSRNRNRNGNRTQSEEGEPEEGDHAEREAWRASEGKRRWESEME